MKVTRTLALLGVLALLAGYVYFYEIKGGEEREEAKELEEKLFNFESDSVIAIDIRSIFKQFSLERADDGWRITNPVRTEADESTINGLLNSLKNLKYIRAFSAQKNELKDYGLVGRSLLVLLTLKNSQRDSIWFGDATPVGSNIFAGKGDTLVYIITATAKNNADKNLFDWRDKSVAKINQSDVREFKLKNRYGQFYLSKDSGKWQIISMLNLGFLIWVIVAIGIASPFTLWAIRKWLTNFAYQASPSIWIFLLAGIIVAGIAILSVTWQTASAADRNPVDSLRHE